jgi:hypothetical protein
MIKTATLGSEQTALCFMESVSSTCTGDVREW